MNIRSVRNNPRGFCILLDEQKRGGYDAQAVQEGQKVLGLLYCKLLIYKDTKRVDCHAEMQ